VTPLVARGACVVLTDNTGNEHLHRPKGSGAKLDASPTAYRVHTAKSFDPERTGMIEIECTRSRHGFVNERHALDHPRRR
jgi:hypothetical protein